jgi:hypothetical protein
MIEYAFYLFGLGKFTYKKEGSVGFRRVLYPFFPCVNPCDPIKKDYFKK